MCNGGNTVSGERASGKLQVRQAVNMSRLKELIRITVLPMPLHRQQSPL